MCSCLCKAWGTVPPKPLSSACPESRPLGPRCTLAPSAGRCLLQLADLADPPQQGMGCWYQEWDLPFDSRCLGSSGILCLASLISVFPPPRKQKVGSPLFEKVGYHRGQLTNTEPWTCLRAFCLRRPGLLSRETCFLSLFET